MGQFSFIYSDTKKAMIDNKYKDSFLLVPPKYQSEYGRYIQESCYDGYGHMGRYDIYDLVAIWNKEYIPTMVDLIEKGEWVAHDFIKPNQLMEYYNTGNVPEGVELREIGIEMACYDADNARLPYPIKIAETIWDYEMLEPSESDPNQGWGDEEDEEESNWW